MSQQQLTVRGYGWPRYSTIPFRNNPSGSTMHAPLSTSGQVKALQKALKMPLLRRVICPPHTLLISLILPQPVHISAIRAAWLMSGCHASPTLQGAVNQTCSHGRATTRDWSSLGCQTEPHDVVYTQTTSHVAYLWRWIRPRRHYQPTELIRLCQREKGTGGRVQTVPKSLAERPQAADHQP